MKREGGDEEGGREVMKREVIKREGGDEEGGREVMKREGGR